MDIDSDIHKMIEKTKKNDPFEILDPLPDLLVEIIAIFATRDRISSYLDNKKVSHYRINTENEAEDVNE
jgi:hypothetical protein